MFKGLSNLAGLMANAGELKAKAAEVKEKLKLIRVEGTAGGGMVTVEATGEQKVVSVRIEESLFTSNDREMVEDLVLAATNDALERAKKVAAEEMSNIASGLGIPGLEDAISKFGMGGQ